MTRRPGTPVAVRVLAAAALVLLSGAACAPRATRPELPAPPPAPPPPAVRVPPPALPPPVPPAKPVRVRLEGIGADALIEGESLRAWDARGALLAEAPGAVRVAAGEGGRIAWRPAGPGGGASLWLAGPLDVAGAGGVRAGGQRLPGRLRLESRDGRLLAVAVLPLEEYVAAVISREAPPGFHAEALKALGVAARTYALKAAARPRDAAYDLAGGVEDQVFEGQDGADGPFRTAAEATRGETLLHGEGIAQAVYHSTCGGATESAAEAWGNDVPYLRGVPCDDCRASPAWRWEYRMGGSEGSRLARLFGVPPGRDLAFEVVGRTRSGRARQVRVSSGGVSRDVGAAAFRRAAGYGRVKSLRMKVEAGPGGWRFAGEGYGHGVGLCQWGANGMGRKGRGYREILGRYYPGARVGGGTP